MAKKLEYMYCIKENISMKPLSSEFIEYLVYPVFRSITAMKKDHLVVDLKCPTRE